MGSIYNAIINPIAWVFGKILDFLFMGLHAIGLGNIAIAIIVFTFLVKILMLPLTVKQSKMMKLNSIIMPEVRKIQDKYKDKRNDQEAMLKMQAETKAVYPDADSVPNLNGNVPCYPVHSNVRRTVKKSVCQHFDRDRRRYHECFRLCGYYGGKLQDDGQNDKCGLGEY